MILDCTQLCFEVKEGGNISNVIAHCLITANDALWTTSAKSPSASSMSSTALDSEMSHITSKGTIKYKGGRPSQTDIPLSVYNNRKNYDIQESNKRTGGCLFIQGKYGYTRNALKDDVLYLRCRLGKQMKCSGTAKVDINTCELYQVREHTCGGSIDYTRGYTSKKRKGSKMVFNPLGVVQSDEGVPNLHEHC